MKVYYAHCMSVYGTPAEQKDILLLKRAGFDIVNPSDEIHVRSCNKRMGYFYGLISQCDLLVFRPMNADNEISSGVALEIQYAINWCILVLELSNKCLLQNRTLSREETRRRKHAKEL